MTRDRDDSAEYLEQVARAWRAADAAELGDSPPAAEAERIWSAAAGEASGDEIRQLAIQAATAPATALALRLARELGAGEELDAPAIVTPAPAPSMLAGWRLWPAAAALAAVLVAVVGLRYVAPAFAPEPIWRAADPERPLVDPSQDGAHKSRRQFYLRWDPEVAPGARYTARVTTSDLTPVFEASDLSSPETSVPESALAAFPEGTTLYWQVEARTPDGRLLVSPAIRVVLSDEPRSPGGDLPESERGTR